MGAEIEIRAIGVGDHDAWLPLWRGYQAFYEIEIPEAVSRRTWTRLCDPSEMVFGALAWSGGAAAGLVHFLAHRSTWTAGDVCYLQDLFVAPAGRGAGTGRALIDHVYRAADQNGWEEVYWLTHETNATARALYDRIAVRSGFLHYQRPVSG
ncbi:GNAT family N-acetyltransferase [Aquabacter spiritensis]|uniref:Acetyltransferase (GNAT) family protein n=1 Tax=Aquabacter spiritensis TaxID=933073 RepID=A0A4R3LWX3_9HYPH|nr:GNAT family N-acetyltransferase [Aquabacter spiritensis]TCT04666.1 acetyltransferase (GNAT) family protein [Aquabacter spiritensis]